MYVNLVMKEKEVTLAKVWLVTPYVCLGLCNKMKLLEIFAPSVAQSNPWFSDFTNYLYTKRFINTSIHTYTHTHIHIYTYTQNTQHTQNTLTENPKKQQQM